MFFSGRCLGIFHSMSMLACCYGDSAPLLPTTPRNIKHHQPSSCFCSLFRLLSKNIFHDDVFEERFVPFQEKALLYAFDNAMRILISEMIKWERGAFFRLQEICVFNGELRMDCTGFGDLFRTEIKILIIYKDMR